MILQRVKNKKKFKKTVKQILEESSGLISGLTSLKKSLYCASSASISLSNILFGAALPTNFVYTHSSKSF